MENVHPCRGCGKSLSDFLDTCPNCGRENIVQIGQAPRVEAPAAAKRARARAPRVQHEDEGAAEIQRVMVTDIHMELGSMVTFLVKLALAAIPAMIILGIIGFSLIMIIGGR